DFGHAPPGAKLSHAIDQKNAGMRMNARFFQFAAPLPRQAALIEQSRHFVKSFWMARHENESQTRMPCCKPLVHRKRVSFFRFLGTAGEKDCVLFCNSSQLS